MLWISLCIWVAAECWDLYANWMLVSLPSVCRQVWNLLFSSFSIIFVIVGRRDMGLMSSVAGDLGIDFMMVWLRFVGISPVARMKAVSRIHMEFDPSLGICVTVGWWVLGEAHQSWRVWRWCVELCVICSCSRVFRVCSFVLGVSWLSWWIMRSSLS
jgi:hypothetical protein